MAPIGYSCLIDRLKLNVIPLTRPAMVTSSVNRRVNGENRVLFPSSVAIDDTLVGHLEFALRHEGVNLEVIDAVFEHLAPADLINRLRNTPTGEHIRRACFLWEWLTGKKLDSGVTVKGGYVDLFPQGEYVTSPAPQRHRAYRIFDNALGSADFCPIVRKNALPQNESLAELLAEAQQTLEAVADPALYHRAVTYLYLSETRGSYAIESETPSADKQERFIQLLKHAGEPGTVTEDWLVRLQNAVVRDVYSQEASYRTKQNWLEDATGQITFFPAPQAQLQQTMHGWEEFINDKQRCTDTLVKAACVAFGFVYLHPFMDGNGRLHRFLIQHVLAQSDMMKPGIVIPVSAVIQKHVAQYLAVLSSFSRPVTALWDYRRGDTDPVILRSPGSRSYRFFDASKEVAFLYSMIKQAVREEIPRELAFLQGYDLAYSILNNEFDFPQKDLSALIRIIQSNNGVLSAHRRKQYYHIPSTTLDRIEAVVRESFNGVSAEASSSSDFSKNI